MTGNEVPKKILVAVDGSPDSILAGRRAAAMAEAFGAELYLVHVVPVSEPVRLLGEAIGGPGLYEEDRWRARDLLDREVRRVEEEGAKVSGACLRGGEPAAEVVALAERLGVDLIVLGSRGLGPLARMPIGSVASGVAAHAPCPVLVVRGDGRDGPPGKDGP